MKIKITDAGAARLSFKFRIGDRVRSRIDRHEGVIADGWWQSSDPPGSADALIAYRVNRDDGDYFLAEEHLLEFVEEQ